MATSGTIGATVTDVTKIIEHAFRRAGVTTSKITGEQQLAAADNLYLLLTDLSNDGVNLWCITKQLIALVDGQRKYDLPVGVVDVLRAFSRTMFFPSPPAALLVQPLYLGIDAGSGAQPATCTVGVVASSGATQNLVVENSTDGIVWTTIYTIPAFTSAAGVLSWFDLPIVIHARLWRVRETVAGAIALTEAQFGNTPEDLLMAKLNRDQYWYLPNKVVHGRELQYWFDKTIIPAIHLWQVPYHHDTYPDTDSETGTFPYQYHRRLMVVYEHMQIQDVGALTNSLAVPQRWLNHVIWELGFYCANERPKEERNPEAIKTCQEQSLRSRTRAETGESDGSPIQLTPNIRCYTK